MWKKQIFNEYILTLKKETTFHELCTPEIQLYIIIILIQLICNAYVYKC